MEKHKLTFKKITEKSFRTNALDCIHNKGRANRLLTSANKSSRSDLITKSCAARTWCSRQPRKHCWPWHCWHWWWLWWHWRCWHWESVRNGSKPTEKLVLGLTLALHCSQQTTTVGQNISHLLIFLTFKILFKAVWCTEQIARARSTDRIVQIVRCAE